MTPHRMRADTYAGGMSTLVALLPFELAKLYGASEDQAFVVAWYALLVLAPLSLALRATAFADRRFHIAAFREDFLLSNYLRSFALCALALLALSALAWFQIH
jgi:hypothetical protein